MAFYTKTQQEHWLRDKYDQGRIVMFDDESMWEVHPSDQLTTARWLRISTSFEPDRPGKKVEALFAELKNQIGLRRLRLRRLRFVREQFFLAAAAQNIKRLVRFLSQGSRSLLPATT
ncbi:MAG TPA: transposase [Terriglobales bacterium]|nr:transposase [Terriglobales bacterium]